MEERQRERKLIGYKPRALDGGYGWVVVLGSFLIHVFADGFVYSFGVIAESLIKEFDSSNTEVSTILSLLTGLMLATGPLASAVCNRIGCRITTIVGASIASAGCAISYFATSMFYLIFSGSAFWGLGIIMGTGFGLMYCPAIVIVTIYFEKYRSLATGITVCGAGVGTFVFSKIIGILIVQFDWRTVFIIYAAVVLLCVPCGALYRPVEFVPVYEEDDDENDEVEENRHEQEKAAIEDEQIGDAKTETGNIQNGDLHSKSSTVEQPNEQQQHQPLRPALSHQQINRVAGGANPSTSTGNGQGGAGGGGSLQRFLSIGDRLNVHHPHGKQRGAVSVSTGYLNVRDVFYPGSISELPEYQENKARFRSVSSLQSHSSATRAANAASFLQPHQTERIEEEKDEEVDVEDQQQQQQQQPATAELLVTGESEAEAESSASRAIEIWRTIKRILDLSLLADPVYLLFGVSNFLTSIGFNAPPMFMPMNAEIVLGWDKIQASNTVSAYGLANTFGRIAFGLVCDKSLPCRWGKDRARNRLWIYNLTLVLCGLVSCLVFRFTSYWAFVSYCFFFGFTISSYVCLTSVVLVDLVGVDRLTNAFGLLLFIQGIATFVGPPMAGKLFDITRRYDWTFVLCGVCLFLSGAMLFVIPWMRKSIIRKNAQQQQQQRNSAISIKRKSSAKAAAEEKELIAKEEEEKQMTPPRKKEETV